MAPYVRRPINVDAIQFTGSNMGAMYAWLGDGPYYHRPALSGQPARMLIDFVVVEVNDWLVRNPRGEVTSFKPEAFANVFSPAA